MMQKCIYPNIEMWMVKNRVSRIGLARLIGLSNHVTLWNYLTGETQIKIEPIKKIIKVTGMPFEVAFATEMEHAQKGIKHGKQQ